MTSRVPYQGASNHCWLREFDRDMRHAAIALLFSAILFSGIPVFAQGSPHDDGHGQHPVPPPEFSHPDMSGKWWTNSSVIRRLGLSNEQQKAIEDIFQQHRINLIDLAAALEKEEALLDPLLAADHPQEAAVLAQIDRVADARATLEKANARMLYAFRAQLTADQWRELQHHGPDFHSPHH